MTEAILSKKSCSNLLWHPALSTWQQKTGLLIISNILLILCSKTAISLQPVPITLQTLAIFFIAMFGGKRLACASVAIYLFEGAIGLPVFAPATSIGLATLFGPDGGYLLGFLPAAWLTGYLLEQGFAKQRFTSLLAGFAGNCVIYIFGLAWLTKFISFNLAIKLGLLPFISFDLLKLLVLAYCTPKFWLK